MRIQQFWFLKTCFDRSSVIFSLNSELSKPIFKIQTRLLLSRHFNCSFFQLTKGRPSRSDNAVPFCSAHERDDVWSEFVTWTLVRKCSAHQHVRKSVWPSCSTTSLWWNLGLRRTHASIKVTLYLQRCLAFKRCSASSLNCRHLNPHIKLKLIELAIKLYQEVWNKMNCRIFHDL